MGNWYIEQKVTWLKNGKEQTITVNRLEDEWEEYIDVMAGLGEVSRYASGNENWEPVDNGNDGVADRKAYHYFDSVLGDYIKIEFNVKKIKYGEN